MFYTNLVFKSQTKGAQVSKRQMTLTLKQLEKVPQRNVSDNCNAIPLNI